MSASLRAYEALEKQLATAVLCDKTVKNAPKLIDETNYPDLPPISADAMKSHIDICKEERYLLLAAQPVFWAARCSDVVAEVAPRMPLDQPASREQFYETHAFHYFEKPWMTVVDAVSRDVLPISALHSAWVRMDKGRHANMDVLAIIGYHQEHELLFPVIWSFIAAGEPLLKGLEPSDGRTAAEDYQREVAQQVRFLLAASMFMRQKLATVTPQRCERHAAKRLKRQGWPGDPAVQVVQLRERALKHQGTTHVGPIEWSCSWLVSGHIRQQWYPSLSQHLPVYIHPYLKGPEDLPLRKHTSPLVVVSVSR